MSLKIAINGFGRIGRLVMRLIAERTDMEVVAVNDLVPVDNLAYLFKYDSTHGRFKGVVEVKDNHLIINGKPTKVFEEKDPEKLPWKQLEVDYVVESTGHFTTFEGAQKHIKAGAKRVVISAPGKDGIPTFVMGVNQNKFCPEKDFIVSNASCTTNCLAPIVKIIMDNFGVEEALMTTIHATTASQPTLDGPSKKDWRGGRGAMQNLIPASTGAAKAVALCIPELKGRLTGMAFRVPVANVSVVDLTVRVERPTTYEELAQAIRIASERDMKGIVHFCDEQVVSSDFVGSRYSAIFDKEAGIGLNDRFYKIIAWYDNEMGYSARVVDFMAHMSAHDHLLSSSHAL